MGVGGGGRPLAALVLHTNLTAEPTCTRAQLHARTHTHTHTHAHAHTHEHVHAHAHACTHPRTHAPPSPCPHPRSALSFNERGDQLASVGCWPDYLLTLWNWEEEAIVLRSKAFSQVRVGAGRLYSGARVLACACVRVCVYERVRVHAFITQTAWLMPLCSPRRMGPTP